MRRLRPPGWNAVKNVVPVAMSGAKVGVQDATSGAKLGVVEVQNQQPLAKLSEM